MPSIYFQEPLDEEEMEALSQEFPHYTHLFECHEDQWGQIEILYGSHLSEKELHLARRLRWIHSPTADTEGLCLKEIHERGNILITLSKGKNVPQIAEFVIGGILAFAKQFLLWKEVVRDPAEFWDWPLKETMWTLNTKTHLQIGLGEVGSTIVKQASALGMRTWGVRRTASFHPYCDKTYSRTALHSILPAADVVCLALPKGLGKEFHFGETEFELMKPDSIFIVTGSADMVDEHALAKVGMTGKFRGVMLDAFRAPPPAKNSPLWEIPNAILTPAASSYPLSKEHYAFRSFRHNLRLFLPGRVNEMKNLAFT